VTDNLVQVPGSNKRLLAEINVTPLVDVMLVLLIIFMITARFMQEGIAVKIPQVNAGQLDQPRNQLIVSIAKAPNGYLLYLNNDPYSLENFRKKISAIGRKRLDQTVYLRADHRVPYGFVVIVIGMLQEAGISNIGLVTESKR